LESSLIFEDILEATLVVETGRTPFCTYADLETFQVLTMTLSDVKEYRGWTKIQTMFSYQLVSKEINFLGLIALFASLAQVSNYIFQLG
jgi:hypothetical protein